MLPRRVYSSSTFRILENKTVSPRNVWVLFTHRIFSSFVLGFVTTFCCYIIIFCCICWYISVLRNCLRFGHFRVAFFFCCFSGLQDDSIKNTHLWNLSRSASIVESKWSYLHVEVIFKPALCFESVNQMCRRRLPNAQYVYCVSHKQIKFAKVLIEDGIKRS